MARTMEDLVAKSATMGVRVCMHVLCRVVSCRVVSCRVVSCRVVYMSGERHAIPRPSRAAPRFVNVRSSRTLTLHIHALLPTAGRGDGVVCPL